MVTIETPHPAALPAADPAPVWRALCAELDAWAECGRAATLWWRDDDAGAPGPALYRLVGLGERSGVPLTLAVIPARATPDLADQILGLSGVTVVQHGWAHTNHAGTDADGVRAGKSELGADRPLDAVLRDLRAGAVRLSELWPTGSAPVLVPPWNRIAPTVVEALPRLGFTGLSVKGPRRAAQAAPKLAKVNVHVDIIDWKHGRGFIGTTAAVNAVVAHLAAKRLGTADADEPTGLLGHHLVQDEACWAFLEALFTLTRAHGAARWLDTATVFATPPQPGPPRSAPPASGSS
jgi:hypothetical protein